MDSTLQLLLLYLCFTGLGESADVTQMPPVLVENRGNSTEIRCSHNDGTLLYMYWYQQLPGEGIKLIAFSSSDSNLQFEKDFKEDRYDIKKPEATRGSLKIKSVGPEDTALYFCAAIQGKEAYFGGGTKLTVLEHNVTNPKVKILHPSKNEIEEKKHVTLVCVAYDFYPDHIDIKWGINGVDVTKSSTMDDSARLTESNKKYIISSRLKITKSVWLSSRNEFSCKVEFYNGSKTVTYPDLIKGAPSCGTTTDENQRNGNIAEFSYTLFLVKSVLFAVFLTFLVFKLKGAKLSQD